MIQSIMYFFVIFIFQHIPDCYCDVLPKIFSTIQNDETTILQELKTTLIRNLININLTEDGMLNFTGLSKKYIRPAEEYDVITEDGYILKLFHIPGNKSKVVLVCHGILMTSDVFIIRGNISLIFMLAKQDYDIWVMNFRGNSYSRRHVTLDPDSDREFWQYYMHEIGIHDYKAIIDFVLNQTGQANLSVVGHSEGAAALFVLLSEKPEYNKKINVFVGLAPACYLRHSGRTTNVLLSSIPKLSTLLKILGIEEVAAFHSLSKKVTDIICSQGRTGYAFYFDVIGSVLGPINPANIELDFIPTLLGHIPAGSGVKNMEHFGHLYLYNRFCKYDYNLHIRNFVVHDSSVPPDYDLNKVTTNVALFAAKNDFSVGVEDVARLKSNLPNVVHFQIVSDDTFNHIDYIWARSAQTVLYPDIINILNKYNNG